MGSGDQPVVDVHAHWLPGSAVDACNQGAEWHGLQMSVSPEGMPVATGDGRTQVFGSDLHFRGLSARLGAMDRDGVDIQILSLLPPLFRYERAEARAAASARELNDELAGELAEGPKGRFLGLGYVPLQAPGIAVAELRRCVEDLDMVGVVVGTNVLGSRWEDRALWDLLEAAEDLGAVVFMHPSAPAGFPLPKGYYLNNVFGNPGDTTLALQSLTFSGAFERFPALQLVAAHGGGYAAFSQGRMDHGWKVRAEVRADTSMTPSEAMRCVCVDTVVHSPAALRFVMEVFGRDNVVLGTDFPADMGLADPVRFVNNAFGADADGAHRVLRGNVDRMLARVRRAPA